MTFFGLKSSLQSKKAKRVCQSITSSLHARLETIKRATTHLNSSLLAPLNHKKKFRTMKKMCGRRRRRHQSSSAPESLDDVFRRVGRKPEASCSSSSTTTSSSSWYERVAAELEDVDARAEMFIVAFREKLRLEGQRSIEEYHAMLARGL